jgi:hypothetical protein
VSTKSILVQGGDGTAIPAGMVGFTSAGTWSGAGVTTAYTDANATYTDVGSIDLSAGVWMVEFYGPAELTSQVTSGFLQWYTRIYNSTDAALIRQCAAYGSIGSKASTPTAADCIRGRLYESDIVTVTGAKTIKLQVCLITTHSSNETGLNNSYFYTSGGYVRATRIA